MPETVTMPFCSCIFGEDCMPCAKPVFIPCRIPANTITSALEIFSDGSFPSYTAKRNPKYFSSGIGFGTEPNLTKN